MRVHASAPARVDLAGGTLDIWPLYLLHDHAQTLNAAITIRAACELAPRPAGGLRVAAGDTGTTVEVAHWSALDAWPALRLLARILQYFDVDGLSVATRSAAPLGSGLAGSSALTIALCAALARWVGRRLEAEALMHLALDLEAQVIAAPTGGQDYRPAVHGGIAAIEWRPGRVTRVPLAVDPDALADRLVIAYAGESRDSGVTNWEVTRRRLDRDPAMTTLFDEIRDVAAAMRQAIEAGDWPEAARCLDAEWSLRRRLAPGVTTDRIEALIREGRRAGAAAAKVCGAGGGGCVVFLTPPEAAAGVRQVLTAAGGRVLDCRIDLDGLQVTVDPDERADGPRAGSASGRQGAAGDRRARGAA